MSKCPRAVEDSSRGGVLNPWIHRVFTLILTLHHVCLTSLIYIHRSHSYSSSEEIARLKVIHDYFRLGTLSLH